MNDDEASSDPALRSILDSPSFRLRLAQEVARVRRSGGFLSLAAMQVVPRAAADAEAGLRALADQLRSSTRLPDILGRRGSSLMLLMPDTTMAEAYRAVERVLDAPLHPHASTATDRHRVSAGVATVYGSIEGGGDAFSDAATEALALAQPGQIVRSRTLEGRPRVLVIDDDAGFAQLLAESLSERGWEGHPCSQVADALQRVTSQDYSALLVDLVLPGSSGAEVLRTALESQPRRPAVLMSGLDADHQTVLDALGMGPVMFVRKPIAPNDLDAALQMFRDLLPGVRQRRPWPGGAFRGATPPR